MPDFDRTVWTLGFGERSLAEFIDLLNRFKINTVVDIRLFPAAGRHRHFRKDALRESLNADGIEYHSAGHQFGAPRTESDDSLNIALERRMRGFADYMSTQEFRKGIARLISLSKSRRLVLVNDPKNFEVCHRKLLADYLYLTEGFRLYHILDREILHEHDVTFSARFEFNTIIYDNFSESSRMYH